MKEYVAVYRGNITGYAEALQLIIPDGAASHARIAARTEEIRRALAKRFDLLQSARVLDGLTIRENNEDFGTMRVSGPDELIFRLREFIESQGLGYVAEVKPPPPPEHRPLPADIPF